MSISRSSKGEYDFQQIQLEHVSKPFFRGILSEKCFFPIYFGDLKSSSRSNIMVSIYVSNWSTYNTLCLVLF